MRLGPMELGLIVVLVLILFGAGRLPDVFTQVGKAFRNFKDAQKDDPTDVGHDKPPQLPDHLEEAELAEREREKAEKEKRRAS